MSVCQPLPAPQWLLPPKNLARSSKESSVSDNPLYTDRQLIDPSPAINKPIGVSSAGVLRDLQIHFQKSALFTPWLDLQRRERTLSGGRKRNTDNLKVKVGHGGTLDPMATGVLIVGVGKGTKCLSRFLKCTKSYECVVLFGAASDSYDAVGKVVSRAPYDHVSKELVEEKLEQFRGKIMQKPSIFSALKVDGKKMYEYARGGKEVPEVQARPVEVLELEMVEWLAPGSHDFTWPKEEVDGVEKVGAEKLLGLGGSQQHLTESDESQGTKRVRRDDDENSAIDSERESKKVKADESGISGSPTPETQAPAPEDQEAIATEGSEVQATETVQSPPPPAARLRMTVTSGFYVRSLCHDLGIACESRALMSSLVRSRQGDYSLGSGVLEYADLESPDLWEPKVRDYLENSMDQEGWVAQEVEDDETWQQRQKDRSSRGSVRGDRKR